MLNESDAIRIKILRFSLNLESIASHSLAFILNIETNDIKNSKSLGNKSSSLSFNQKVNLLLDNKSIEKGEKLKLEFFMSVRNQFMHNLNIVCYKDAVDNISGLEQKLRTFYPDLFKSHELEKSFSESIQMLYIDGIKTLVSFKGGKQKKASIEAKAEVFEKKHTQLLNAIKRHFEFLKIDLSDPDVNLSNEEQIDEFIAIMKYQILADHSQSVME